MIIFGYEGFGPKNLTHHFYLEKCWQRYSLHVLLFNFHSNSCCLPIKM